MQGRTDGPPPLGVDLKGGEWVMQKEKVTIELPSGILDWFERRAKDEKQLLAQLLEKELVDDAHADIIDPVVVAQVIGTDVLVNSGAHEELLEFGYKIDWM